jgi:hypothetical protein
MRCENSTMIAVEAPPSAARLAELRGKDDNEEPSA